jgi:hypothetical protein
MCLGKQGARMVIRNRELLFKIHSLYSQTSAI